jgi:outer membrane cobalamin receptor
MRFLKSYLLSIFLLSSFPLFSNDTFVKLSGKIVSTTDEVVDYASVFFKDTKYFAKPNGKGEYVISLPPGSYTLIIKAMGYNTIEKFVTLEARKDKVLDVLLEPSSVALDEVLILAKSPVQQVNESAYNVVALDAKLLHNTTLDLAHALDKISGIKIKEVGGVGSNMQIALNGFSGKHVRIFMDGMPMEGFGSSFQINNIPVNLADRIEVYKGVVPVNFSADALGGVINIVTKHTRRTYLDASYAYGSFNTHKSNLSLGHTTKNNFTFQLIAYQNYSDNTYKIKTKLFDLVNNNDLEGEHWFRRFHDNYHNETLITKAGFLNKIWADKLLFGITLSQEKADIQNANLMKIVYGGRERKAKSIIPSLIYEKRNLFVKNLNLSVTSNYNIVRNNNIDTLARKYNWKGEYVTKNYKGEGNYSMSEFDNISECVIANLNYKIAGKHDFIVNNIFSNYTRKATDIAANAENSTAATFMKRINTKNVLGFSYKFEPHKRWNTLAFVKHYEVNVRGPMDVSTTTTAIYEEKQRSYSILGDGVAMTCFLTHSLQLKSSFEKAYRLPSEQELFGDEVLETGDASLLPENSRNINFNLSYNSVFNNAHAIYFDAAFIYRDTRDYIRRQIEQRYGGAFYSNHGKVRNLGVDLEARYFYKKNFSAGGNFSVQDIRNQEQYSITGQELIYYKDRMPNVPYFFGNADLNYNLEQLFAKKDMLSVGYNLCYVHSFFRNWQSEGGDIIIPQQLSHNVNLTYTAQNGQYNIALEVRNLTNEILYDNYSLQKPGRSFMVKLRYFFSKPN